MNAKYRRVPTRFAPDTEFELNPLPVAPFRRVQESRFENLRSQLLGEKLVELADTQLNSQIRRAANEAAALAWVTPYPLLVFPVLFDEKAFAALARAERQHRVFQSSRELLTV